MLLDFDLGGHGHAEQLAERSTGGHGTIVRIEARKLTTTASRLEMDPMHSPGGKLHGGSGR